MSAVSSAVLRTRRFHGTAASATAAQACAPLGGGLLLLLRLART